MHATGLCGGAQLSAVQGKTGIDQLPHRHFWMSVAGLVKDGEAKQHSVTITSALALLPPLIPSPLFFLRSVARSRASCCFLLLLSAMSQSTIDFHVVAVVQG